MAVSSLQPTSTTAPLSVSLNAATSGTYYKATELNLPAGVYRITCVSTTNATVTFISNGSGVGNGTTSSGTIDVSVTSGPITEVVYNTNTGSNIKITISFLATPVTPVSISGTLDTLTSGSGTYTQTGNAYVVLVGGGGSGAYTSSGGAGGGGSGGVLGASVVLTGSIAYSVGAKGAKVTSYGNGNSGGNTTFGSFTATGGGGGQGATGGLAGTPNGGAGAFGARNSLAYASAPSPFTFCVSGTTGGGGYGTYYDSRGGGAGSGIGTGGTGGQGGTAEAASNATGYGAGGGAGVGSQPPAEATGGIIYIFRY